MHIFLKISGRQDGKMHIFVLIPWSGAGNNWAKAVLVESLLNGRVV